jgi:nicotinamidase/pyrazinamidase
MNKALIIVDMQNDFISSALAVPRAAEIVGLIQDYAFEKYSKEGYTILLTRDWHPRSHCSFNTNGGQWPVHCVGGTPGAFIQIGLSLMAYEFNWPILSKGQEANVEEYSGFPVCRQLLRDWDIHEVEICGLARDYCVEATYQDCVKVYPNTVILENLCRSVNSLQEF